MKKISCIVLSILIVIVSTFISLSATRGDVNSDGKINATDALCILQYSVGYIFLDFDTDLADINVDGKVNSTDALVVLRITVGAIQPSTITTTTVYEPVYTTTTVHEPVHTSIMPTVTWPEVTVPTTSWRPMTTIWHTTTTTTTQQNIYNTLAIQRRFGFNKAYDSLAGLANCYLDTIRVYFTYNGRDWLIELWKGEYAMDSVGCEIGYYYNDRPSSNSNGRLDWTEGEKKHFKAVGDEDAMYTSMELWQYVKSTDVEPVRKVNFGRRLCWWAADFEKGVLENHRDRTALIMRGSIEFPTNEMRDLFVEGLEERGFKEGSTTSYTNTERYSVSGKKVTIMWRYFDEDKFQTAD